MPQVQRHCASCNYVAAILINLGRLSQTGKQNGDELSTAFECAIPAVHKSEISVDASLEETLGVLR